jgi:hypothetical protein
LQIGFEVFNVFQAHREAQQALSDASRLALSRPCEVVDGWVKVVLVSPRLDVTEQMRVASDTAHAPARSPLTTKESTAPPSPDCWAIASACCGCDGRPG